MLDLLPCPFCGSSNLITEGSGVMCADTSCAGSDSWHRTTHWQNRKKTDDQLKIAYAQFEASLKAEREKKLPPDISKIIKAAEFAALSKWEAGPIPPWTADSLTQLGELVRKYKREKA